MRRQQFRWAAVPLLLSLSAHAAGPRPGLDLSTRLEMNSAAARGIAYLTDHQRTDGSWSQHPGITAFCMIALMRSSQAESDAVVEALPAAATCVRRFAATAADPDRARDTTHIYSTSVALVALSLLEEPPPGDLLQQLRAYLEQFVTERVTSSAFAYRGQNLPDISNLHWALEALHLTRRLAADNQSSRASPVWPQVRGFVSRCQVTDPDSEHRGGFSYSPVDPAATPVVVWGSLTYAGIRSLLFCGNPPSGPRIVRALDWGRRHYTVAENPGLYAGGYYYYLYLLASTHLMLAQPWVVTADGARHNWRLEVVHRLLSVQRGDGHWRNSSMLWLEDDANLCTAYAVLIMEMIDHSDGIASELLPPP